MRRKRRHHLGSLELPAPGAPEPLSGYVAVGDCGCGCKGSGGCQGKAAMGGPLGDSATTVLRVGSAAAAYYAYKSAGKQKGSMKYVLYAIAAAAGYEAAFG